MTKGEFTRKPGHDAQKHLPEMWPVVPSAARWGEGEANPWIEHHAQCLEKVQAMKHGIDVVLLGDSITQSWGGGWDGAPFHAAWQKHFAALKTVNLGIGGDVFLHPLQELVPRELAGGRDGAVVALRGGDDEVEVHVQAQGEDVAGTGRRGRLASDGVAVVVRASCGIALWFIRLGVCPFGSRHATLHGI